MYSFNRKQYYIVCLHLLKKMCGFMCHGMTPGKQQNDPCAAFCDPNNNSKQENTRQKHKIIKGMNTSQQKQD